jgi:thioredoxin reductase (NADPH)
VLRDVETDSTSELAVSGMFVAIGHDPNSALFHGQIDLDPDGYIITNPGSMQTSVPGVYAGGDVQDRTYRQAVTAAGTGCMAALEAEKYIEALGDR